MKIGFDAFPLQEKPSGIGKYILALLKNIIEYVPDAEFIAYSNREIIIPENLKNSIKIRSFQNKLPGKIWLKFFSGKFIKEDNLDYYISTSGFFPILSKKVKKIAIIHDFNYKLVPETMGRMHFLSHLLFFKKDVKSADFIICNSQGTANKLKNYFNKDTNEIINPPVSDIFYKRSIDEINHIKQKYNINSEYVLFVGNLEPRKNLKFVIENYLNLINSKKIENVKLVIVGLKGWKNKTIDILLKKHTEDILVLGYVEENDLPAIYSGAKVFVFPSIYEGFGIPVRESLLCGTPIITTEILELKESANICSEKDVVSFIKENDKNGFQKELLNFINIDKKCNVSNKKISIEKTISFFKK